MTGAMYAAIGGLKAHMSSLNVIGNNIANVNTNAYKAQRMTFQESMYTTSRAGSNGTVSTGGNNPSQVGYGSTVGSIDLNMSPGTFSPTGYDLDCMIDGEGFFLVGDKDTGDGINSAQDLNKFELTRMGDFWVDPEGYVCDRRGKCVYGFAMVQNPAWSPNSEVDQYIPSTRLVPLRLPLEAAAGQSNYDAGDPVYSVLTDADGTMGNTRKNFSVGEWVNEAYTKVNEWLLTNDAGGDAGAAAAVTYNLDGTIAAGAAENNGPHITLNVQGGKVTSVNSIVLPAGYNTSTGIVQEGAADTTGVPYSGPIPNGENKCVELKGMSINKQGAIVGTAENGKVVTVGYVAVANAAANDGVTHVDGYYYKALEGAGDLRVSVLGGGLVDADGNPRYLNNKVALTQEGYDPALPPTNDRVLGGGDSEIRNGGLEMSTADVANEFAQMILTQRGYQANTRVVTVTDSMLEELVNMKR